MSGAEIDRVKYSISIEIEVPSHKSTQYLPNSLIVIFDKEKEQMEEANREHPKQLSSTDDKVLDANFEPDRKLKLFMDIFHALASENRDDVKKETLIDELVNTGKYTEQEALVYIVQAQQYGFIFERRIDMYAST